MLYDVRHFNGISASSMAAGKVSLLITLQGKRSGFMMDLSASLKPAGGGYYTMNSSCSSLYHSTPFLYPLSCSRLAGVGTNTSVSYKQLTFQLDALVILSGEAKNDISNLYKCKSHASFRIQISSLGSHKPIIITLTLDDDFA